jgi:hypothetical protein
MSPRRVRDLLDRVVCLSHPCDLDLLLFFRRHPRTVLTSEHLALYAGYELSQVAQSLETLIGGGLLTRTQRPTGTARMYLLTVGGPLGGWMEALLRLASTRDGRLAVIAALSRAHPSTDPSSACVPGPTDAQGWPGRAAPTREAMEVGHA